MKRSDFHFDLPPELIAQHPLAQRSDSRLLQLSPADGRLADRRFHQLPDLLRAGDLLVFNDTRVIPARLHGRKETGGRVEILVERLLNDRECLAQVRASKSPRTGGRIELEDGSAVEVLGREDAFFRLGFPGGGLSEKLQSLGHMPLPPYIEREDTG
ncbi:MAG: S-adenosylmethionine:tRNA ribosyltransferase-isomerase, partial [Xanthomonadales bacterium]|nr:S-adenosylmethionine:tRNA ribosyltransferase-isomerase [Xanthomonadales bacterium]